MSTPGDVTKRPLPDGWRWVRLGELCEFNYGESLPTHLRRDGKIPVYGSNGVVGYHDEAITNGNTIVIGRKGSIGEVHFCPEPCWPIDTTYYIEETKLPCDLRWLAFSLKALELAKLNKAAAIPGLNREDAYALEIPLPPLAEQQRIAAMLREQMAAVERARRAAEEQLEAAKALPAALLRRVFPRAGEPLPDGWRWVRLGEVCEERTGVRDPRQQPDSQFRYVDITSVDNKAKRIIEPKTLFGRDAPSRARQVIRTGDVLVATTRPNLNAVALVPPELDNEICSTGFCVLRAKTGLNPDFLFAWVQTPDFVQGLVDLVKGALYPAVTDNQVRAQEIPLPPLSEQQRIAAILHEQMAAVERARQALEAQLEAIHKLPAAILRKAFNGAL